MCGIAGAVGCGEKGRVAVASALACQKHRGPDGEGIWSDDDCALGQRRLAIIDLSPAGQAPLSNEDGSVWVTHNGEIYNFQSIRNELERLGHRFRSGTDTEVIVHAYEQWGKACVERFRGMWAFAVWDQRQRTLFLSRDRVGKKPLFYAHHGDRFLFSSELQGLLALPEIPRDVDLTAIDAYLSWGYIPAPFSAFQSIKKLLPAHSLTLDLGRQSPGLTLERFWSLPYEPKLDIDEHEAAHELRERLREAVALRLVSDVPVGAFLSGGIDSSIIVALMAELSSEPIKTFSIGFEESDFDELRHARRVAERCETDHQEFVVQPDAMDVLPTLVRHYGEPFADSSALPTFYVSQMTRGAVTVALNGDGGDESFAGYDRYRANRLAAQLSRMPAAAGTMSALARLLPDSGDARSPLRRLHRFLEASRDPEPLRYQRWVGLFTPEMKRRFYTSDFSAASSHGGEDAWFFALFDGTDGLDPVDAAMSVDIRSYLPYDLLVKVDIASMANSLETRSPLLDTDVMQFAARLPANMKLRARTSKYLLKKAFKHLVPAANLSRAKRGFAVPVGRWFRGPLRDLLYDCLLSDKSLGRGYFEPAAVRTLVAEHLHAHADHGAQLWSLLMLEMWHREAVGEAGSKTETFPGIAS